MRMNPREVFEAKAKSLYRIAAGSFRRLRPFVLLLCIASAAMSTRRYVAVEGSEGNDGTRESPWKTIEKATGQNGTGSGQTVLAVQDARFTLNGQPAFLLGLSYYGALGAPEEFIRRNLDDVQRHGFNWLRVFATWTMFDHDISAVDAKGLGRQPFLDKLKWLMAECDRRTSRMCAWSKGLRI